MAVDATNNSQQKPTTLQQRQQHRICLQSKTDHFTYVWITPFVIDYMHHIAIDCSSAMKLLLFSGFDFTFCRACVCLSDYVCTLKCIVCGYALWPMPFAVFDLHLYRHRLRYRYCVRERESAFVCIVNAFTIVKSDVY